MPQAEINRRTDAMKRPIVLAVGVAAIVLLAALGGAYVYFFSGLRTAPRSLGATTASPAASASSGAAPAGAANLVGSWTVGTGSQAGYRVKEQFAGQSSKHEAVARTSSVSGDLAIQQAAGGLQAKGIKFTAQLANLQSVDQVAGFNVTQRDRIVSRALSVSQYPDATFEAQSINLPASIQSGGTETLTIPGQLTIHGVTKPAQVTAQVKLNGSQVQANGSTAFNMTDFGISPPQVPITTVEPGVTLDFQLILNRT
jgi:polyisoprenoid-binding protein YceI